MFDLNMIPQAAMPIRECVIKNLGIVLFRHGKVSVQVRSALRTLIHHSLRRRLSLKLSKMLVNALKDRSFYSFNNSLSGRIITRDVRKLARNEIFYSANNNNNRNGLITNSEKGVLQSLLIILKLSAEWLCTQFRTALVFEEWDVHGERILLRQVAF